MERDLYDLLQQKLNEWNLMDDPNFRWCPHVRQLLMRHSLVIVIFLISVGMDLLMRII